LKSASRRTRTEPQSQELRERFPDFKGRVLLQDRPEVVEQAKEELKTKGIEAQVHDMFTPQTDKDMMSPRRNIKEISR
jgi:hypothetical protein